MGGEINSNSVEAGPFVGKRGVAVGSKTAWVKAGMPYGSASVKHGEYSGQGEAEAPPVLSCD